MIITVKSGDTIESIIKSVYGVTPDDEKFLTIYQQVQLANPSAGGLSSLIVGQALTLPDLEVESPPDPPSDPGTTPPDPPSKKGE